MSPNFLHCAGGEGKANMYDPTEGMRVLDVEGLGYEAAIVTIDGETVLLLDVLLDCDERIDVMNRAMAQVSE